MRASFSSYQDDAYSYMSSGFVTGAAVSESRLTCSLQAKQATTATSQPSHRKAAQLARAWTLRVSDVP